MSNPIYTGIFSQYQVLTSAQLDALLYAINSHDHGTEAGGGQPINLSGLIAAGLAITTGGYAVYAP